VIEPLCRKGIPIYWSILLTFEKLMNADIHQAELLPGPIQAAVKLSMRKRRQTVFKS
jgi:hypothetical protein